MIIDAHTHTYPETIAKRAIEKLEKNSGYEGSHQWCAVRA